MKTTILETPFIESGETFFVLKPFCATVTAPLPSKPQISHHRKSRPPVHQGTAPLREWFSHLVFFLMHPFSCTLFFSFFFFLFSVTDWLQEDWVPPEAQRCVAEPLWTNTPWHLDGKEPNGSDDALGVLFVCGNPVVTALSNHTAGRHHREFPVSAAALASAPASVIRARDWGSWALKSVCGTVFI